MSRKVLMALAVPFCLSLLLPAVAIGQTDVTPPALDDFSFVPTDIDISTSNALVQSTFMASDDLSGVGLVEVTFTSPGSPLELKICSATVPISGTPLAGTFECTIDFPQGSQIGVWTVLQIEVQDFDGNSAIYFSGDLQSAGFPTELTVSQQPDVTPPTLIDFNFTPLAIDTMSGPATVLAMFDVTDDITGIAWIKVGFISPGSTSILRGCTSIVFNPGGVGAEGGGSFDCEVSFPQFSEAGTWTVVNVEASDIAGNNRSYSTGELTSLGFPTVLNVASVSDLVPPTLIDFSFAPDSLAALGGDHGSDCGRETGPLVAAPARRPAP